MRHAMVSGLMAAGVLLAVSADAATDKAQPKTLILRAEGLSIIGGGLKTPVRISFDTPRAKAIATIATMRGPATKSGTIEDCGSGTPMGYANFRGGLELSFVDGKFVGWTLDEKGDHTLKTLKGVGLGTTRKAFKATYPKATVEESSLGIEYASDDAGSGIFSSAKPDAVVETMWAGQTCIAR